MVIGLVLVAIGVIALLIKQGVLAGSVWSYTWPLILIILGLSWLLGGWRWKMGGRGGWWCCGPRWRSEEEDRPHSKGS